MLLTSYEREKLKAFANLNSDSKRDDFVRFNPEVKKSRFAIEALLVAQGAWQKKQIPTAWMYAIAAFFLGGEISDTFIGAEAAKLAMETAPLTGNSHLTNMFRASEFALREESKSRIQPLPNNSVQMILSETLLKTKVAFPNIDNCYSQVREGAKACYYSTAPQQVIEELIKGLNSNEPEVIMLSMLILGILSLATDAKISI